MVDCGEGDRQALDTPLDLKFDFDFLKCLIIN